MSDEKLATSDESQDQSPANETEAVEPAEKEPEQESQELILGKFETQEQLASGYQELERAFHSRRDKIKDEVLNELSVEHQANVPESPGDYSMVAEINGESIEIPETPMTNWFRDKAHDLGLGQDQFQQVALEYMQMEAMSGPAWENEAAELGEHADMRLERIDAWAKTNLSNDAYGTFAAIPATAAMVQTFEELMELNGQPQFAAMDSNSFQEELSQEDLRSMQNDPRYWRDRDPAFINKVQQGFRQVAMKKYGTDYQP